MTFQSCEILTSLDNFFFLAFDASSFNSFVFMDITFINILVFFFERCFSFCHTYMLFSINFSHSALLLRAQERPATLILTVTSGLRITRACHVYNREAQTGS